MSQPTRFFSWLLLLQLVLLLTVGAACLATGGSPVGYVTVAFLGVAGAWAGAYLIHRFVERQHRDFIRTTQGIRDAARSGETHLLLRTERADDSFGKLANELNASSECVAASVAELHSRCRHLERNDTLFHAILGTMVEGVLVLDSSQNVLYVNDAARNMLNCTGRGIEGRPVWELIRASEFESLLSATELMEDNYRKEVTLPRNKTVVEVTAARLPIEPAPGTVLVLHNVTELRKLERMRREFVSNVSHELKTPLTSIQAYAETLLDSVHD
ncbi:MAG: PAS domain S-box protein, partial [Planctomycetaceae bacterium]|nr:PAS domain S-box protein [Planctomycetaceae bacterium]